MNIVDHMCIYSKVVLLDLEVGCFLIFWEITILISKAAVPVCAPTSNGGVFVPITPRLLQHMLSSVFLILAILTGVRWNLRIVLICISLLTKDVEHFLKYLSVIWDSYVESSLFRSLPNFSLDCMFFWVTHSNGNQGTTTAWRCLRKTEQTSF